MIDTSRIANSQVCGQLALQTLLYHGKYAWGNAQLVQIQRVWLRVPKSSKEKDLNKKLLHDHHEAQSLDQKKAMHHKEKSLKNPEQYMCLTIDGMDQNKTMSTTHAMTS